MLVGWEYENILVTNSATHSATATLKPENMFFQVIDNINVKF